MNAASTVDAARACGFKIPRRASRRSFFILLAAFGSAAAFFGAGRASAAEPVSPPAERMAPPDSSVAGAPDPALVTFTSGGATLHGWLYVPAGQGPFPAVLYNHGSEKNPGWFPPLGKFWTEHGFVFFVPHRRGHGRSPGDYIVDLQREFRAHVADPARGQQHDVELHERANLDVVAALAWLRAQAFVKPDALVVSGISYGGIQTVLTAEQGLGVKAFVAFAPGAMSWGGNPLLRERLLAAIKKSPAPIFLLQAGNDYSLGPSELLGGELKRKGAPNRAKIYPAFGNRNDPADGHAGFAVRGSAVWGADVTAFVDALLRP